jgi:transposase InsO family protein
VRAWEGWLYLATVIDLFSRRVIGWAVAEHMRAALACGALDLAVPTRGGHVAGVIFHSDRSQYTSAEFRARCPAHGAQQSMGTTGVCWDNALAEVADLPRTFASRKSAARWARQFRGRPRFDRDDRSHGLGGRG